MADEAEASAHQITLNTGYRHAAQHVKAILDMNGRPATEPVVYRHPLDLDAVKAATPSG
jgi:hypothetical protein